MISVVCPVLNEAKYISKLLDFFLSIEPSAKELWIADGGSTDGTQAILEKYATRYSIIKWIPNKKKYVPFALNSLLPLCKGDIIVRWDAHTTYSPDYLTAILETFKRTGADIVGGPMRVIGEKPFQKAVATATSSRFGVGNSSFHFEDFEGPAESVYLGAWKRSVFDKIGYFDEQMLRNQDDEFHYRAKVAGLLIYQSPSIRSYYYPRSSLNMLFKQYFGYGLFKPLVLRKVRMNIRVRHVVPAFFVSYFFFLPLLVWLLGLWAIPPLVIYLLLLIIYSAWGETWQVRLLMLIVYPTLHIAYGLGFWSGFFKKPKQ